MKKTNRKLAEILSKAFEMLLDVKVKSGLYDETRFQVQPFNFDAVSGQWRHHGPADSLNQTWNSLRDNFGYCVHEQYTGFDAGTYYFTEFDSAKSRPSFLTTLLGSNVRIAPSFADKVLHDKRERRGGGKVSDIFPPNNPVVDVRAVYRGSKRLDLSYLI